MNDKHSLTLPLVYIYVCVCFLSYQIAWNHNGEMRSYVDIKDFDPKFNKQTPYTFDGKEPSTRSNYYGGKTNSKDHVMPDEATKALRRAYYACVSHSDHELGRSPPCCARYALARLITIMPVPVYAWSFWYLLAIRLSVQPDPQ